MARRAASSIGSQMDIREIRTTLQLASRHVQERRFSEAEGLLSQARAQAKAEHDLSTELLVVSELVELYCVQDPPDTSRAEQLSLEREALDPSAESKWQTGMLLYWHKHEPAAALTKLHEAIAQAKSTGDSGLVYTCLALSGLALLDLKRLLDGEKVLEEIERMIEQREPFVVGDETLFLEKGRRAGLSPSRVARVAALLIPICREPTFIQRLKDLANV
jgi:hypothetical protein